MKPLTFSASVPLHADRAREPAAQVVRVELDVVHDAAELRSAPVAATSSRRIAFARVKSVFGAVVGRGRRCPLQACAVVGVAVVAGAGGGGSRSGSDPRTAGVAGRRIGPLRLGDAQVQDLERHVLPDSGERLLLDLDEAAEQRRRSATRVGTRWSRAAPVDPGERRDAVPST